MSPERARYILEHKVAGCGFRFSFQRKTAAGWYVDGNVYPDGITPEEHEAVMERWRSMDGGSSYFSALCEIARPAW